ncbi:hypothetical protein BS103_04595 [Acinetobacter baumannii]|nr:hypothetical protein BS103_04595 [Acinetobacter baumannii]
MVDDFKSAQKIKVLLWHGGLGKLYYLYLKLSEQYLKNHNFRVLSFLFASLEMMENKFKKIKPRQNI